MVVGNAVFQAAETIKNPLRGAICASSGFQPVEKVQKDFFDRLSKFENIEKYFQICTD